MKVDPEFLVFPVEFHATESTDKYGLPAGMLELRLTKEQVVLTQNRTSDSADYILQIAEPNIHQFNLTGGSVIQNKPSWIAGIVWGIILWLIVRGIPGNTLNNDALSWITGILCFILGGIWSLLLPSRRRLFILEMSFRQQGKSETWYLLVHGNALSRIVSHPLWIWYTTEPEIRAE
ncbi:MAG: hypothetical protein JNL57_06180 [Bacteroidetes bacterium]|nr:hypothetical protein [Bacteroidota bacterium]